MHLRELTLTNFCQHRDCRVDFSRYLTGIIGPNGAGKSNLVAALRWVITGDNQNEGPLSKNINQLAGEKEPASVELTFEHGGRDYQLSRHLRPRKASTLVDATSGSQVARGDKAVTAALFELLSSTAAVVNAYVLVSQGDMFEFLAKQPAKRAAAFQKLFQLDRFEQMCNSIDKHVQSVPQTDSSGLLAAARDQLSTAEAAYQSAIQASQANPPIEDYDDAIRQLWGVVQTHERRGELLAQSLQAEERIGALQQQATTLSEEVNAGDDNMRVLKEEMASCQHAKDRARQLDEAIARAAELSGQRETAQRQLDEAIRRQQLAPAAPSPPHPPRPNDDDVAAARSELSRLEADYAGVRQFLDTFSDGVAECPTCGTPTQSLADKLEEYQLYETGLSSQIHTLKQSIEGFEHARSLWRAYDDGAQKHETRRVQLSNDVETWRQRLENIPAPPSIPEDADAIREAARQYDEYVSMLSEYEPIHRKKVEQLASVNGQLQSLRAQLDTTNAELSRYAVPEKSAEDAQREAAEMQQRQQQAAGLQQAAEEAAGRRRLAQERVQQLEEAVASEARDVQWLEFLSEVRSVVHRDGLPKILSYNRLQQLQESTNEILELFEAEFRVAADEQLSFTATFPDGRVVPASRLSGGQQIVLAVAFRASVNSIFAGEVGFLMLDEPTVYLDRAYVSRFSAVLGRMKEFAASRGLQIVIITHEGELSPLFDEVVSL